MVKYVTLVEMEYYDNSWLHDGSQKLWLDFCTVFWLYTFLCNCCGVCKYTGPWRLLHRMYFISSVKELLCLMTIPCTYIAQKTKV